MLPVEDGQFTGMQRMAMRWPNKLKQAAAVCNSLTLINKKQVVGDAADKQAFKAVEARFLVSHHDQSWRLVMATDSCLWLLCGTVRLLLLLCNQSPLKAATFGSEEQAVFECKLL